MLLQKFQPLQHVTFRRARDARQLAVTRASAEQNDFGDGLKDRSINAPRRSASESLDALDLLLSGDNPAAATTQEAKPAGRQGSPDGQLVEWWRVRPKQAAKPRQNAMAPGSAGRFLMNEDLFKFMELRAGRKTEIGSQLELPRVQPVVSFALLLANAAFFGTWANVGALQGEEAAHDFLLGLLVMHPSVTAALASSTSAGAAVAAAAAAAAQDHADLGTQLGHMLTASFMAPGPAELVLTLWALAVITPRAESVAGYLPFLSIYLLSGATSTLVQSLLMQDWPSSAGITGACGAAGALMGSLAFLLVHHLRNGALEKQAQVLAAEVTGSSNSSASSSGSSSSGQGSNQQSNQQAHVWQAVGLAAATLGLAVLHGGQSGSSLSDSALLVTGLSVPAILAGAAAGTLLSLGLAPELHVLREVDIPEGSMWVPDNVQETVCVIDRVTSSQRVIAAGGYAAMLAALASLTL